MIPDADPFRPFALFDGDDGGALLLSDYRRALSFEGSPSETFAEAEYAAAQGEWVALNADYELGAYFERAVPRFTEVRPPLRGWVFGRAEQLGRSGVDAFLAGLLARLPEHERAAGVAEIAAALGPQAYGEKIAQVRRLISDGDCYQINLTFPLNFRHFGHPLALYAALRRRQPVRYGACIVAPDETVLSLSPELFFARTGTRVVTRPMKGTAPRGATPEEDEVNRRVLLSSAKERAENIMIVDLLRNDLGRLARAGAVRVESLCDAEAYPTVWQVVSSISADLPGVSLHDIFQALFPCGSITGAPKIRAMQCIAELEGAPRGLYTGAIGWLAPGGDCRFNVAIRTPELGSDGRGRLGIGGGIVIDARADAEYAECLLKARFLTGLDPGFELIETLRLEDGDYPLLALHLQRLETSAGALGFACDVPAIQRALEAHADLNASGAHRVRLTLAHAGTLTITSAPLGDDPSPKATIIAAEILDPDDYLLRHKTTARSRYDNVLKSLAGRPEVFDAIFLNSRGEVCEGARSNVFVERDGVLLTPPLSCGLLPGVMRRSLLESGRAAERVLTRHELSSGDRVFLGNALRGLIPVNLID